MIPRHHPPDELLLDYATGAADEAVALVIATHAALCPPCRARVADLEAVGGVLLDEPVEAAGVDALLDHVLGHLDALGPSVLSAPSTPPAVTRPDPETAFLPEPLRSYVPTPVPWKRMIPGLYTYALPVKHAEMPVYLMRSRPKIDVPMHAHPGLELNLVLAGGYTDPAVGGFRRGDVQFTDESVRHRWTVDPGEDCVSLLLRSGRDIQLTWAGKLFAWATGA